jgi:hypothetical protein
MLNYLMLLFTAVFLFAACGQRPSEKLELNLEPVDVYELQISSEIINEIIQNIASPIEVAAQINALNVPYSTQYLTDAESLSTSTSSFEMAYSLGALNANLVYLNMYEKTGSAVIFLSSINRLADALQIGQFFDYDTIKRLATSSSDLDSLMFISVNSFNNMETYLRETDRSNLSSLMIAGVWIEGLYLSTQVAKLNSNEDLRAMIGEQKLILNDLLLILNKHKNEKIIADYIKDFELIKTVFDEVKITFKVGEPRTIEKDGNLIVVQSEFSQVSMSDETLQKIIEITEQVRNTHVNKKA